MPLTKDEETILTHVLCDDEGIRLRPYRDTEGKLTIGVGRNLTDVGISSDECYLMLSNDIKKTVTELEKTFLWFRKLNSPRKIVIASMGFNLGLGGLKGFKNMIRCLESGDFQSAAGHMLKSKWAEQVKGRAERLARIMFTGQF